MASGLTAQSPELPDAVRQAHSRWRIGTTVALVAAGAALSSLLDDWYWLKPVALACVPMLIVVAIAPLRRRVRAALEFLADPSPRHARWTMLVVAVASALYLYRSMVWQAGDIVPTWHDEQMLLIQAQMLARGRLWMPMHPMADFFETFHVFVRPVYAPMHFPGTALMNVPGVWLGLPHYAIPLLIAAATAALLYRVATEAVDGVAGLLCVLWLWCLGDFRFMAVSVRSQMPVLLLGLALVLAWTRWRRDRDWRWAAAVGALAGWAAITRPLEAVCFAAPIGLFMAWQLRRAGLRAWAATAGSVVIAAMPFLGLQLVFDKGVTGHWLRTPHQQYVQQEFPGAGFGFSDRSADRRPQSKLPQMQVYYDAFVRPALADHTPDRALADWLYDRLPLVGAACIPSVALFALIFAGSAGIGSVLRSALVLTMLLFLGLYAFFPFFIADYLVSIVPTIALLGLLGKQVLEELVPRLRSHVHMVLTLVLAGVLIGQLPEVNAARRDPVARMPLMHYNYVELPRLIEGRALVLFTYANAGQNRNPHLEPVYNVDVAWPDDARIVRAHDLGPERNQGIIDYYAGIQADRMVYIFDRPADRLVRLGRAGDLASRSLTR
jgi:hypothetical protein